MTTIHRYISINDLAPFFARTAQLCTDANARSIKQGHVTDHVDSKVTHNLARFGYEIIVVGTNALESVEIASTFATAPRLMTYYVHVYSVQNYTYVYLQGSVIVAPRGPRSSPTDRSPCASSGNFFDVGVMTLRGRD